MDSKKLKRSLRIMYQNRTCTMCGREFTPNCGVQKVCSYECGLVRQRIYERNTKGKKPLAIVACAVCGTKFKQKTHNAVTCSKTCQTIRSRDRARENGRKSRASKRIAVEKLDYRGDVRPWGISEDKDPWLTYRADWCIGHVTDTQLTPLG